MTLQTVTPWNGSRPAESDAVRVLVVDASVVTRSLIAQELRVDPAIEVVGAAANGEQAIRKVRDTPVDVVLLDIEMPVMDGLTALPLILAARPGVRVIMVSTLTNPMAAISLQALRLGASDYIPKRNADDIEAFRSELITKVKALGAKRKGGPAPMPAAIPNGSSGEAKAPTAAAVASPARRVTPQTIAIGGSTGGPAALMSVFESLKTVRQPILVTQHMPPAFTKMLADNLARISGKTCAEAVDGEPVEPGRVYVAPGGWHMTVSRTEGKPTIHLNQDPPEHFCRPAVDPMLRSLAHVYGPALTAIILTGMGADGAAGCQAVAEAGGRFVVQDEATSVVWGMPAAAAKTGFCEQILPLCEIGPWVARISGAAL